MKNFTKCALVAVFSLLFYSCSSNTERIEEDVLIESVFIPTDKQIEIEILEEINNYRMGVGLSSLAKLNIIKSQTYNHTTRMVEDNQISHINFSSRRVFLLERTSAVKVGENVAVGFQVAEDIVNGWINSDGHKKVIEGNYTHFDISAEQNENGTWFYTNIFIKK